MMKWLIIISIIFFIVHIFNKRKENKTKADIAEYEYWEKVFKRGKYDKKYNKRDNNE